ncbi:hypothetical protein [Rothia amarae]|uniref:hypothetical protein n=1 Tax=Rothia amarae TaxID=169480 RepID=UPI0031D37737
MTENIDDLIDRLRELDQSASPAPWHIEPYENMVVTGDDETGEEIGATYYGRKRSKKQRANREMLTDARNAVPALLAEIERLYAELETAREEAWEACADKAYELYLSEEQRDELMQANPYREESA